jgi:hypothetical protein
MPKWCYLLDKTLLIIAHISANYIPKQPLINGQIDANYCYKWCKLYVKTTLIIATNGVNYMLKQP